MLCVDVSFPMSSGTEALMTSGAGEGLSMIFDMVALVVRKHKAKSH